MKNALLSGVCVVCAVACGTSAPEPKGPSLPMKYSPEVAITAEPPTPVPAVVPKREESAPPVVEDPQPESRFEENGPGNHGITYGYPGGWDDAEGRRYYGGLAAVALENGHEGRIVAILYPTVNERQVEEACGRMRGALAEQGEPMPDTLAAGDSPQVTTGNGRKTWVICRRALPKFPSYTLVVVGAGPRYSSIESSSRTFYESLSIVEQ